MQRYSDVPERSQSQMQISELQHDIQKLAQHCQAMYHRLTNTENVKSIPVSSMVSQFYFCLEFTKGIPIYIGYNNLLLR